MQMVEREVPLKYYLIYHGTEFMIFHRKTGFEHSLSYHHRSERDSSWHPGLNFGSSWHLELELMLLDGNVGLNF